ncbi:MAG TPA: lipase family protein, partial [Sphingomicrobium sp.]
MAQDSIAYDASYAALLRPESRPPLEDFSASWERDAVCAELARLAYIRFDEGHEEQLAAALGRAGFSAPKTFAGRYSDSGIDRDAQAFATTIPGKAAFVAFRGTQADKWRDLVSDVDFLPMEWGGPGKVHRGFWKAYASLREPIAAWVGEQPQLPLVITGHSLGAAMATLMAAEHPQAELVTFGSPRVGTKPFVALFAGRNARRYVDCADAVTQVPPEGLLDARHVEAQVYIDGAGQFHDPAPDAAAIARDRRAARLAYLRKYGWKFWNNVPSRFGA